MNRPVCLVIHPDKALCEGLSIGIARCITHRFRYQFVHSSAEACSALETWLLESIPVGLLILDCPERYVEMVRSYPAAKRIPYAFLETQKDDFYAELKGLHKKMRNHTDVEGTENWDKSHLMACIERTLNPLLELPAEVLRVEPSPLVGINQQLERQMDPATLIGVRVISSLPAASILHLSSAISEIQLRRERRREVIIPLANP